MISEAEAEDVSLLPVHLLTPLLFPTGAPQASQRHSQTQQFWQGWWKREHRGGKERGNSPRSAVGWSGGQGNPGAKSNLGKREGGVVHCPGNMLASLFRSENPQARNEALQPSGPGSSNFKY